MIEKVGGITLELIGVALDAALLRHEIIANNIANYSTPGFFAKQLSFEEHLAGVTDLLQRSSEGSAEARIAALRERLQKDSSLVVESNETVELDREMLRLTENTLRYQTLLKAAVKQGELLRTAINGGIR